ncbi:hypothetical protein H8356DRAFT_1364657 [Neocallimastix lanati (nom. inval.)]|nr:hypothetical protein H8356DRAFT_1364657 [Neocallimastix sp. JGI-2020a]
MECPNILFKRTQIIDSELIYFICDSFYNSKKVNHINTMLLIIQIYLKLINSIKLNHFDEFDNTSYER